MLFQWKVCRKETVERVHSLPFPSLFYRLLNEIYISDRIKSVNGVSILFRRINCLRSGDKPRYRHPQCKCNLQSKFYTIFRKVSTLERRLWGFYITTNHLCVYHGSFNGNIFIIFKAMEKFEFHVFWWAEIPLKASVARVTLLRQNCGKGWLLQKTLIFLI